MSDLNFVKTLHGTGNIIKSLLLVGLLTKIVKLADYRRSKVIGVSMETNPCKMKPNLLRSLSESLKVIVHIVSYLGSLKWSISKWTSLLGYTILRSFCC